MMGLCQPKTLLLLLLLIAEVVMSLPLPKSRRRRKPNSHQNHRHNLLKVYNFNHSALKLKTPTNSKKHYYLWSKNAQVFLQANKDQTPGTNDTRGLRAEFTIEVMATGIVRFKNIATNRYLSINHRGRLLLQRKVNNDCLFRERVVTGEFNTYASYKYYKKSKFDVYIGVQRNGDIKSPLSTLKGQKAIMFTTFT